jgi:hypothetical protein
MGAPTSDLEYLFEVQMQQSIAQNLSSLKPRIFFILSSFWVI